MKKLNFLFVLILFFALVSCPSPSSPNNTDPLKNLAGSFKTTDLWGTLAAGVPNNMSNTFTADPKTTRTITWQSTIGTGDVVIGSTHYPSVSTQEDSWFFHRVDLTGLEAGKTYTYIAGSADAYSPVCSFTTESAANTNGFTVLHITDPQIGTGTNTGDATVWKRVIESAVKKCPSAAFIVNTGDVVNLNDESVIPFYFDYAQKTIANYAFIYSMGNNDSPLWYNKYFYTSNNGYGGGGILYSFDYGDVHFVNVDSNVKSLTTAQLSWLENDLNTSTQKWKVAMMHEACYGRTSTDNDITKLFDNYNVDLVLSGHNHFYARSRPIDTAGNDKVNGTVWTIPNVAGTKFNDIASDDATYLAVNEQPKRPMFTELKFTSTSLELHAYTVSTGGTATQFDSYIVVK